METNTDQAREFYGASYNRAKDSAKLDKAFTQFRLAPNASSPSIQERALNVAAKTEAEAFA